MHALVELPPLSQDDDTFCLAIIEYGGNLGAAFRAAYGPDEPMPVARARDLLCRPEIAKRVNDLQALTQEHAMLSLGSHLVQLAEIRDLAKDNKQLKVALDAEKTRGIAVGFYDKRQAPGDPTKNAQPLVQINIGGSHANIEEWAQQHGNAPVVIDMPK